MTRECLIAALGPARRRHDTARREYLAALEALQVVEARLQELGGEPEHPPRVRAEEPVHPVEVLSRSDRIAQDQIECARAAARRRSA